MDFLALRGQLHAQPERAQGAAALLSVPAPNLRNVQERGEATGDAVLLGWGRLRGYGNVHRGLLPLGGAGGV